MKFIRVAYHAALLLAMSICPCVGVCNHTPAQTNQIVRLMLREVTARRCFDMLTGESRPEFPPKDTAVGFFQGDEDWSAEDRQGAFDWYLANLHSTAVGRSFRRSTDARLSVVLNPMGNAAVNQCLIMHYTNAVETLRRNALGADDGCRTREIDAVIGLSEISQELTEFIRSLVTNEVTYSEEDRCNALEGFAAAFSNSVVSAGRLVLPTEPSMQLFRDISTYPEYARVSDDTLCSFVEGYLQSSNRLASIQTVLVRLDQVPGAESDLLSGSKFRWMSITNQLHQAAQPLPEVEGL